MDSSPTIAPALAARPGPPRGVAAARHPGALLAPLALLALLAALWLYLRASPLDQDLTLALGAVPSARLSGFHAAETTAEGRGVRWTSGPATLPLPAQGPGTHVLAIELGAPRPAPAAVPVALSLNGAPLAGFDAGPAPRRYLLLAPAGAVRWAENRLGIASATFSPGGADRRELGVAVFALGWRGTAAAGWLPPAQALALAVAAATFALALRRGGLPWAAGLLAAALFVAIALSMRHTDPRFVHRLLALALTGGLGLLAAAALLVARPGPGDGPLPWRRWLRLHWPAMAGFVALTALMLWPLLPRLATHVPGHPGDAFEYVWKLELFSEQLLDRRQSPTFVPELMHPAGFELAHSEMTPANTLLGLPLTRLFGPIASYNLLNLASYVLSGFFCYLLIHRLGARRLAAFVGAIAFAFAVRRFYHLRGHLPLMPTQFLPLALYGLEGLLTRRRSWDAYVAAVGLALATWASLYYGTTFALFMAAYVPLRLGLRRVVPWAATSWRPLALGALVLVALVAPFAQPYLEVRAEGTALRQDLANLAVHAARPDDYLRPNPYHPLFGDWARQFQRGDGGEHLVAPGYSVMALAAVGLWLGRPRRLAVALAALIAATFVLTLGPFLALPGGALVPLPALLINQHVPLLDGIRVWNRVVLYLILCLACLIGLGLTAIRGRAYRTAACAAAALLLFELAAVTGYVPAGPRPVDRWLGARPGHGATIELPATPWPTGSQVLYASYQGRPSNLWYGTFPPPLFAEGLDALASFPSRRAINLLRRWGTAYVIVDEGALGPRAAEWAARAAALPELRLLYDEGGYRVYGLTARK